jgi:hydroxymethylpyrimidine/phosphomethylpyrimidine kinase
MVCSWWRKLPKKGVLQPLLVAQEVNSVAYPDVSDSFSRQLVNRADRP